MMKPDLLAAQCNMHATRVKMEGFRLMSEVSLVPSLVLRSAVTVGVFDAVATEPRSIAEIAEITRTNAARLKPVLEYLHILGYLSAVGGKYGCSEAGHALVQGHSSGLAAWLRLDSVAGMMDHALWGLPEALRSTNSAFEVIYGATFWEHLARDDQKRMEFDAYMTSRAASAVATLSAIECDQSHLIDVGGGAGHASYAMLQRHPRLRATVIEKDESASIRELRRRYFELSERIGFEYLDITSDSLPKGDLYLLFDILHDWPDEACLAILNACRTASVETAEFWVVEQYVADPPARADLERNIMMMSLFQGSQRTQQEMTELVGKAQLVPSGNPVPLGGGFSLLRFAARA